MSIVDELDQIDAIDDPVALEDLRTRALARKAEVDEERRRIQASPRRPGDHAMIRSLGSESLAIMTKLSALNARRKALNREATDREAAWRTVLLLVAMLADRALVEDCDDADDALSKALGILDEDWPGWRDVAHRRTRGLMSRVA